MLVAYRRAGENQKRPMPQIQRVADQADEYQFGMREDNAIKPCLRARPDDEERPQHGQQGPPARESILAGKTDAGEDEEHPDCRSDIVQRKCRSGMHW